MSGQVKECTYNKAKIRVHSPVRTKEEETEKIKAATEKFMKKIVMSR